MRYETHRATGPLAGRLRVPGDKSISHRAVLFAAMAEGASRLSGVLDSADVRSTMSAVRALGARVEMELAEGAWAGTVTGWGSAGPVREAVTVDCGNSGTTTRLLAGVLAGWPVDVTFTGDASLSTRPMRRVTEPLSAMGASFETTDGHLPMRLHGNVGLMPLAYESPVASAQVKSAVLLAGLRAHGSTSVTEPAASRDHTERMLPHFGVSVHTDPATCSASLTGPAALSAVVELAVPADPSSAAFPATAAALVPGSEVVLEHVALNPTRAGFLVVLERMGADVAISVNDPEDSEPAGDVTVRFAGVLSATTVSPHEVPQLIDEVPILAVAAAQARGITRFEGVGELRVKESDRLQAIIDALTALGVEASAHGDTLEVVGLAGAPFTPVPDLVLPSLHDHRLAMAWAVAGLCSTTPFLIEGFEAVDVSYPSFAEDLSALEDGDIA